jgi:hypothetical protein
MGGACDTMVRRKGAYRVLLGKPEGKRPLIGSKHRRKDLITTDLQEIEWDGWHGLD